MVRITKYTAEKETRDRVLKTALLNYEQNKQINKTH